MTECTKQVQPITARIIKDKDGNKTYESINPDHVGLLFLKYNKPFCIEKISADNLNLNLGAGKVEIDNIETYTSTLIDGGAGKIDINNGLISYLNFDMGVGEVNLTARVLGKSEIDCGIGAANINLLGNSNDYQIDVDKGIGEFTIDNVSVHDEDIYGSGINSLDVDGGFMPDVNSYCVYVQNVDAGVYIVVAKGVQIVR